MIIPLDMLSEEALDNLITEYCTRDHGLNDIEQPVAERKAQVMAALTQKKLVVLYSETRQTAWISLPPDGSSNAGKQ